MKTKCEFEKIINKPLTLRKFYNLVVKLMNENNVLQPFDWDDFKRWNGQIHDTFNNDECTYKFITEFDAENASYVYYLELNK